MTYTSFKLRAAHTKILYTIHLFNEENIYPSKQLIYFLLIGADNLDVIPFRKYITYGSLSHLTQKQISRFIRALIRNGYIKNNYIEEEDDFYFSLTDKAISLDLKNIRFHLVKKKENTKKLYVYKNR